MAQGSTTNRSNIVQLGGTSISTGSGVLGTGTLRVVLATDQPSVTFATTQSGTWNVGTLTTLGTITNVVHVDDNAGSLTVDGTVAFSNSTIAVTNTGTFAIQAAQSGVWTVSLPSNASQETGGNLDSLVSVLGAITDESERPDDDASLSSRILYISGQIDNLLENGKMTNELLFLILTSLNNKDITQIVE